MVGTKTITRLELAKSLMALGVKLKTATMKESNTIYNDALEIIKRYEAQIVLEED